MASILLASQGQLTAACGLVFLAALFDVLDGLAARALGGGSELGKQLDSLADIVSFGVAPGMIACINPTRSLTWITSLHREYVEAPLTTSFFDHSLLGLPLAAFIIVVASCWRLAKFNIDLRQSTGFLGLPTPANALLWASLGIAGWGIGVLPGPGASTLQYFSDSLLDSPTAKTILAAVLAVFMLSELPLPSLKFKHFHWKGNEVIYLLLALGAVLIALYGVLAVPLILIIYLLSPLWGKLFPKSA